MFSTQLRDGVVGPRRPSLSTVVGPPSPSPGRVALALALVHIQLYSLLIRSHQGLSQTPCDSDMPPYMPPTVYLDPLDPG